MHAGVRLAGVQLGLAPGGLQGSEDWRPGYTGFKAARVSDSPCLFFPQCAVGTMLSLT